MIRAFRRMLSQVLTGTGVDDLLVSMNVPGGSVIHDIKVDMQLIGQTEQRIKNNAVGWAIAMYMLPLLDPDRTAVNHNTIFDELVPKDVDNQQIDYDLGTADTSNFWEPGEHNLLGMYEIGKTPELLYYKHKVVTMVNGSLAIFLDTEATPVVLWHAGEQQRLHIGRAMHVEEPSILALGMASPAFDDTTAVFAQTPADESDWVRLRFIEALMEDALIHQLGETEAGATTPYVEASALLLEHLEPNVFEETTDFFDTEQYNVVTEMVVDHSLQGTMDKIVLSSSRD